MKILLASVALLLLAQSGQATIKVDLLLDRLAHLVAAKAKVLESKLQLFKSIRSPSAPAESTGSASSSAFYNPPPIYGQPPAPTYAPTYDGYKTFIQNNYYTTAGGASLAGSNAASTTSAAGGLAGSGSTAAVNSGNFAGSNAASNAGSFAESNAAANSGSFAGSNAATNSGSFAGSNAAANAGSLAATNTGSFAGSNAAANAGSLAASNAGSLATANAGSFAGSNAAANAGSSFAPAAVSTPISTYGLPSSSQYVNYLSDTPRAVDVNVAVPGLVPNVGVVAPGVNFNLN